MAVIKETAAVPMAVWKENGSPPFYDWKEWAKAFTERQRIHFLLRSFFRGWEQQMIPWASAHECGRQYSITGSQI